MLVVHGDADAVESTALLFEMHGYEVRTACNGVQAVQEARAAFCPHLMLLDIGTPGTDGYTITCRLQELESPSKACW